MPAQPDAPAASNAYRSPFDEPMYTTPSATVGEELVTLPVDAVHSGAHTFGTPAQPDTPAASKAYRFPSCDWT